MVNIFLLCFIIFILTAGAFATITWYIQLSDKLNKLLMYGVIQLESSKKLELAARASLDACEAVLDFMHDRMSMGRDMKRGSLKNAAFFTTEDGKIQANNVEEFLRKLDESKEYKDVADSLREQLENETKEEEGEDEEEI